MPKNFKEELVFTLMMAGLMVLVMTGYNIAMSDGLNADYILATLTGYPLALLVAIVLDMLIVGPIAKKLFFNFIFTEKMQATPIKIAIGISTLMVLGMVSFMSLFGIVMSGHLQTTLSGNLGQYAHTWVLNLLVALPLQLLIVGPIARFALSKIQAMQSQAG